MKLKSIKKNKHKNQFKEFNLPKKLRYQFYHDSKVMWKVFK